MPICTECQASFIVNIYLAVCDSCGTQIEHHYAELQEFRARVVGFSVITARIVFGEVERSERVWRVG